MNTNNDKLPQFELRKNLDKKNEHQPDYVGETSIDGQTYHLAAWQRTTATGKPYLSGKVTPVDVTE